MYFFRSLLLLALLPSSSSLLWPEHQQQQRIFKCTMSHRCETRHEIHTIQSLNWLLDTLFCSFSFQCVRRILYFVTIVLCFLYFSCIFLSFLVFARFVFFFLLYFFISISMRSRKRCRAFLCHFQSIFVIHLVLPVNNHTQLIQIIHSTQFHFVRERKKSTE